MVVGNVDVADAVAIGITAEASLGMVTRDLDVAHIVAAGNSVMGIAFLLLLLWWSGHRINCLV